MENQDNMEKKEPGEKKQNKAAGKKRRKGSGNIFLHVAQHTAIVVAAILITSVFLGSYVMIETKKGTQLYQLNEEEKGVTFEGSKLFSKLLGNNAYDIIGYGAIRSQLETDGRYDAGKRIDVTAYANRYNNMESEYITADYYLEDLIKWSRSGFEDEDVYMTGEDADRFLSRFNTITKVNLNSSSYDGGTVTYLNSDLSSMKQTQDVSANEFQTGEYVREDTNATVLRNRYHSADGKNIEKYVATWDDYYTLCENLKKAADDLATVYEEYLNYEEIYKNENSNVIYFIRKTVGDDVQVFTNMELKGNGNELETLKEELLLKCGGYFYYDPSNMVYETNTLIEESTLRYILNGYEYAYPENTQVMIGVDKSYAALDSFQQAKNEFGKFVPYYWQYIAGAISCIALYLFLLILLTMREGNAGKKETGEIIIRLKKEDRIYTEVMLLFAALTCFGFWNMIAWFVNHFRTNTDSVSLTVFAGTIVLAGSLLFSFFYYSFVRRVKARTLYHDSLVRRVGLFLIKWGKFVYQHSDIVLRVWVPFGVFVIASFVLTYAALLNWKLQIAAICALIFLWATVGILLFRSAKARQLILQGIRKISEGDLSHKVNEKGMYGDDLVMARAVNSIGDSVRTAVETSMKDERLKADLITNVSHDIKTPLTSIINYIDLIKRENVQDQKIQEYIAVLDAKSQRLKQLTDDLVEASKISSGNIVLQWERINLVELLNQTIGEFSEKFEEKSLHPVMRAPKSSVYINADSRRIWRVIENLFNNIFKYALPGTRVYIDMELVENPDNQEKWVILSLKNISANPLKVNPDELTERFIRGDESRTTEGSGLGLSIAKNLTELQNGYFEIVMDGDLFKVNLSFPLLKE